MRSVLSLEQPGGWRFGTVVAALLLAGLPIVPLLVRGLEPAAPGLGPAFWRSVRSSAAMACGASGIGVVVGMPLGIAAALYRFPGRRVLLVSAAVPLLVPPVLWAIGWAELAARIPGGAIVRGAAGAVLVFAATVVPLVLFVSYAATRGVSRSQVEAALLSGGAGRVFDVATRHALVPALLAAALGGVMMLSAPGVGEILGVPTVAGEVLASVASRYDLARTARQCLVLTALVVCAGVAVAPTAGARLGDAVLARQATSPQPMRGAAGATAAFAVYLMVSLLLPLVGLLLPIFAGPWPRVKDAVPGGHVALLIVGAVDAVSRTGMNTVLYAAGAAFVATVLGFGLACAVGRIPSLRSATLGAAFVLCTWPPAAGALGVATVASVSPAWLDPVLRSRATVCAVLGLRLCPVSAVLGLRAWGAMAPAWAFVAALHGVPMGRYLRRVVWPALRTSAACSMLVVSLLASADIGTVLLLHPPGEDSLPLTIITVMANAPTITVATLCLLYLLAAAAVLIAVVRVGGERS